MIAWQDYESERRQARLSRSQELAPWAKVAAWLGAGALTGVLWWGIVRLGWVVWMLTR